MLLEADPKLSSFEHHFSQTQILTLLLSEPAPISRIERNSYSLVLDNSTRLQIYPWNPQKFLQRWPFRLTSFFAQCHFFSVSSTCVQSQVLYICLAVSSLSQSLLHIKAKLQQLVPGICKKQMLEYVSGAKSSVIQWRTTDYCKVNHVVVPFVPAGLDVMLFNRTK